MLTSVYKYSHLATLNKYHRMLAQVKVVHGQATSLPKGLWLQPLVTSSLAKICKVKYKLRPLNGLEFMSDKSNKYIENSRSNF